MFEWEVPSIGPALEGTEVARRRRERRATSPRASAASSSSAVTRRCSATSRIPANTRADHRRGRLAPHRRRGVLPRARRAARLLRRGPHQGDHHPRRGEVQPAPPRAAPRRGCPGALGQARRPRASRTTRTARRSARTSSSRPSTTRCVRACVARVERACPLPERPKVVLHGDARNPADAHRQDPAAQDAAVVRGVRRAPRRASSIAPLRLRRRPRRSSAPSGSGPRSRARAGDAAFASAIGAVSISAPMPCSAANASISRMAAGLPMSLPQIARWPVSSGPRAPAGGRAGPRRGRARRSA